MSKTHAKLVWSAPRGAKRPRRRAECESGHIGAAMDCRRGGAAAGWVPDPLIGAPEHDLSLARARHLARRLHISMPMRDPASKIRRSLRKTQAAVTLLCGALFFMGSRAATAAIQPLESIRSAAAGFVSSQMPPGQNGIVVTAGRLDPRLRLARCGGPLDASLLSGERVQAQVSIAVACRAGADWTIYVPVTVQSRIRVWALTAPHMQGARLTPADVVAETRLVSGLAVGYVTDLSQLAHSTLRQPLAAGAVLTSNDLLADFMVHQGQQVVLIASADGIRVRAPGVALQDGRRGALVRVQNASSEKVVQGVVASEGVVNVTP